MNIPPNEPINNGVHDAARPKLLRDYCVPRANDPNSSINPPTVTNRNFEIKPALINMVSQQQFGGFPHEDPHLHLSIFLGICETININGVTDEAIRLRLFQFSLKDKARAWLFSLPANSIQTWDQLFNVFIAKYFPPSKTSRFRNAITNFEQRDGETLCEAWDRYKDMLRCCPHHGLERWLIVQTFYNGLNPTDRLSIDASAGGAIMNKEPDEAYNLIEEIAINQHYWIPERKKPTQHLACTE